MGKKMGLWGGGKMENQIILNTNIDCDFIIELQFFSPDVDDSLCLRNCIKIQGDNTCQNVS